MTTRPYRAASNFSQSSSLPQGCGCKTSMHLQRWRARASLHRRDAVLYRSLYLLEGAHLDLAHALARYAELGGQLFKRDPVVTEPPRLDDAPLPTLPHPQPL